MKKRYVIVWVNKREDQDSPVHHTPVDLTILDNWNADRVWKAIIEAFVSAEPSVRSTESTFLDQHAMIAPDPNKLPSNIIVLNAITL